MRCHTLNSLVRILSFIALKAMECWCYLSLVIQVLKDGLSAVHVPYSYGFAIILLTILVKAATLPLTKKQVNVLTHLNSRPISGSQLWIWSIDCWVSRLFQVESTLAMQNLQPQIKAIQQRYAGNQVCIAVGNFNHWLCSLQTYFSLTIFKFTSFRTFIIILILCNPASI